VSDDRQRDPAPTPPPVPAAAGAAEPPAAAADSVPPETTTPLPDVPAVEREHHAAHRAEPAAVPASEPRTPSGSVPAIPQPRMRDPRDPVTGEFTSVFLGTVPVPTHEQLRDPTAPVPVAGRKRTRHPALGLFAFVTALAMFALTIVGSFEAATRGGADTAVALAGTTTYGSAFAFVLGGIAAVTRFGRAPGIVAMVVSLAANPFVLTFVLTAVGDLWGVSA
jgi:hypothetical protein